MTPIRLLLWIILHHNALANVMPMIRALVTQNRQLELQSLTSRKITDDSFDSGGHSWHTITSSTSTGSLEMNLNRIVIVLRISGRRTTTSGILAVQILRAQGISVVVFLLKFEKRSRPG
jgi:hypothetical protein